MKKQELAEIKKVLSETRERIIRSAKEIISERLNQDESVPADTIDVSTSETQQATLFRLRDREKYHLKKIDIALAKMEASTYGLCDVCEQEIDVKRLLARPETTLCIECKEEQERNEGKQIGDRDRSWKEDFENSDFIS